MRAQHLFLSACLLFSAPSVLADAALVVQQNIQFEATSEQVQAIGSAEAIHSVVLYPAVGDRVTNILFTPGQRVQKDQLLLELDSRRQKDAVEEAQIKLKDAERTLQRLENSYQKGAIAKSERDDALTARDLAKVALSQAQTELEDRQVRAPFTGIMGISDIEVGDRITEQTVIASIDDTQDLYVNFNAPESAIGMLRDKAQVSVVPWHQGGRIQASVSQIDSRIDAQTRTIRVKAKISNQGERYIPGMSFRVYIEKQGEQFASIPEAAMLWGASGPYVWKNVDGIATRVDVKIAQRLDGRLLVSGDITLGDQLIVEGVQRLRAGQAVRVAPALAQSKE